MLRHVSVLLAGFLFAVGLSIGGMTQPAVVIGFLDFTGGWDPALVFVLGGAVGTYSLLYRWIKRQRHPVFETRFQIPSVTGIDRRLISGAVVFGTGWGIGGFCPGPALTSLVSGHPVVLVFVVAMVAGTLLFDLGPLATAGRFNTPGGPPASPHADGGKMAAVDA